MARKFLVTNPINFLSDINSLSNRKEKYTQFISLLIVSIVVGVLNIISISSTAFSLAFILAEIAILLVLILFRKYSLFYSIFIIFVSLSIEISTYSGLEENKSLTTVRFLGINVVAWVLVFFIFFALIAHKKRIADIDVRYKRLFIFFVSIVFIALVVGFLNILVNDNGIKNIDYVKHYIAIFYIMGFCPILFILAGYICISTEKNAASLIKKAIVSVLFGCCVQGLFSYFNNYTISLGGLDGVGIASSNIYFYLPFALLLFFYEPISRSKYKIPMMILLLAGIVIFLINNANGKFIISLAISFLICFLLMKPKTRLLLIPIVVLFVLGVIFYAVNYTDVFSQYLLKQKIEEVAGLLNIFSPSWFSNMPPSPRFRISELLNILAEYYKKPYYFVFGKGYLGSIVDHLRLFERVGGDFSDDQWANGTFFYLHESFNLLFLNNGLFGLILWFRVFALLLKKYKVSFFLALGCVVFLLTYGYSFVLSLIGFASLIVGLFDCTLEDKNNKVLFKGGMK